MSPDFELSDLNNVGSKSDNIRIVAGVITDALGRVLLVRKRSTMYFMQPGGKIESGEELVETLARELYEELGCNIVKSEFLGEFSAPAANENGHRVEAALFRVEIAGSIEPRAEIEETAWLDPSLPTSLPLAPLTREHVIRLVRSG